jgi:P4 family phage/plasmid primase-like protien
MSEEDVQAAVDEAEEFDPNQDGGQASSSRRQLAIGSDVEIARRVAAELGDGVGKIVFAEGAFWFYAGTHWRALAEHALRRAVQEYDGAFYPTGGGGVGVVRLNKGHGDSVLHEMGVILAEPEFFPEAATGINCASGFIRFSDDGTPTLESHHPDHRCRHVLRGRWTANDPLYDIKFMLSLLGRLLEGAFLGDPDAGLKVALLQEIAGSAALGHATKLRQPKAVILKGDKAENGKSQILELFRGLLPSDAIASLPAGKMEERYLPLLIGKHLNAADELSSASAIASEVFKTAVTGEYVTGREAYRAAVTFKPMAQHVFCTNSLPSFAGGMDKGVQRRLLVITFNRVIPMEERIEQIGLRIAEEEADLLLSWAVKGAARLLRQRGFTVPPSSKEALHTWLYSADPVLAWIQECVTEVDPASPEWSQSKVKSSEAYRNFKRYALAEGYQERTLPAITGFGQRLLANCPTIHKKHGRDGNWLVGLKIDCTEPDVEGAGVSSFTGEPWINSL